MECLRPLPTRATAVPRAEVATGWWKWCGITALGGTLYAAPLETTHLLAVDMGANSASGVLTEGLHSGTMKCPPHALLFEGSRRCAGYLASVYYGVLVGVKDVPGNPLH